MVAGTGCRLQGFGAGCGSGFEGLRAMFEEHMATYWFRVFFGLGLDLRFGVLGHSTPCKDTV